MRCRLLMCLLVALVSTVFASDRPERVLELPNASGNPRNSEGDFVTLADGRILFIYTHYDGESSRDAAPAHLASRVSADGGRTWSAADGFVLDRGAALNVMSVSLLRLGDGRIALFYMQKDSLVRCLPVLRYSTDEAQTWSEPVLCLPPGREDYYILNNDRAYLTRAGRLVLPLCLHSRDAAGKKDMAGRLVCSLSDDGGRSWRFGSEPFPTFAADGHRVVTQEPGVVELKDGRLMMWARTGEGVQYVTYSQDGGETWVSAQPWNLHAPCSPAQVTRLGNGDLLAVWNDHAGHPELRWGSTPSHAGFRTPLALAVSSDEGRSWRHRKLLEGSPWGWYCYPAVCETNGVLTIAYCAVNHLAWSRITQVPLAWLYGPDPDPSDPTTRLAAFPTDVCDGDLPPILPAPRSFYRIDGTCDVAEPKYEEDKTLPREGYRICGDPAQVRIFASSEAGRFYAQRTLAQLIEIEGGTRMRCFRLFDAPRYPWRGVLLDEGRHFFGKEAVMRVLDLMADYKLNVLHWHLTEDQGWRLEVPGYPELNRRAATRAFSMKIHTWKKQGKFERNTEPYGPFIYSADDIREVVAFAAERHIMVVPEVDMPGHVASALAAYPEFACRPENCAHLPRTTWGVEDEVLCVGNDKAVKFLEDVFDYVADLFPGPYVHIGGDECPRVRWSECPKCQDRMKREGLGTLGALQSWLVRRIAARLEAKGKRIVGWDEILTEEGIPKTAIGQCWRVEGNRAVPGYRSPAESAAEGYDLIVSPWPQTYFCYKPGLKDDPCAYNAPKRHTVSLADAYSLDPCAGIEPRFRSHVLGGEACNWAEYTWNFTELDWKMWPRTFATAEALWTAPPDRTKMDAFLDRAEFHRKRLISRFVNCSPVDRSEAPPPADSGRGSRQ